MDNPAIDKLVEDIRLATSFKVNKQILREKIQTDLHITHNGGLFKITHELYSFVILWQGDPDMLFLEDVYGNPIKINQKEFIKLASERYQSVMNEWHNQHDALKKIRKV